MSRTKIDYDAAEREYVISSDSIRTLATKYDVAFSSLWIPMDHVGGATE